MSRRAGMAAAGVAILLSALVVPTVDAVGDGSISGIVRDDLATPVNACTVHIARDGTGYTQSAVTATDGSFTVVGLSSGTYDASVTCPGAVGDGRPGIDLGTDEAMSGLDLEVARYGAIEGNVTDVASTPIDGACVQLRAQAGDAAGSDLLTVTTSAGEFAIESVPPGEYRLAATTCADGSGAAPVVAQTYLGGGTAFASGAVLTIAPGQHLADQTIETAAPASISGTVTVAAGASASEGCVEAYAGDDVAPYARTTTASDGTYTLRGLGSGPHDIRFCGQRDWDPETADHQPQWHPTASSRGGAVPVEVGVGAALTGIDTMLGEGGRIIGTVRDANGAPVLACVWAQLATGEYVHSTMSTTADRAYELSGLPSNTYRLYVNANSFGCGGDRDDLLPEYHPNAIRLEDAEDIVVSAPDTTTVDLVLDAQSDDSIGGVVTGPDQHPAFRVCVRATGPDGRVTYALTEPDGSYGFSRLDPGDHQVGFDMCPQGLGMEGYEPEYWDDSPTAGGATPVAVGVAPQRADADLERSDRAKIITGTVTASGVALANECVSAHTSAPSRWRDSAVARTLTAADGSYFLQFSDYLTEVRLRFGCGPGTGYVQEWHSDKADFASADPVTLVPRSPGIVDADLAQRGRISGTVTVDGIPRGSSCVRLERVGTASGVTAISASDGTYSILVDIGDYTVGSCDDTLVPVWYDSRASAEDARVITVGADASLTGVDLATRSKSDAWGQIRGMVTGEADTTACVEVLRKDTFALATSQLVDLGPDGSAPYTTAFVAPSTYAVRVGLRGDVGWGCPAASYSYFDGQYTIDSADDVVVWAGGSPSSIDLRVPSTTGRIEGRVTDSAQRPMVGVCVSVVIEGTSTGMASYDTTTDGDGSYQVIDLAPGTYRIALGDCDQDTYLQQTITGVDVLADRTATRDVQLTRTGRITGAIDGAAHVAITAFTLDGVAIAERVVSDVPAYELVLPPGTVNVRFIDLTTGAEMWFDDTSQATADPIVVAEGVVVPDIDVLFDYPPSVAITSPADGEAVRGSVTLAAVASDDVGVIEVEFFVDGASIGADTAGADGWSLLWRPLGVGDGRPHLITAVALDARGHASTSAAVSVRVLSTARLDLDGDGDTDIGVFRPTTGEWSILGLGSVQHGQLGDIPVPGDYDGDGTTDIATYRPTTSEWNILGTAPITWGKVGDTPVPGDYNGDGTTDIATYRPTTSEWDILGTAPITWGRVGDTPLTAATVRSG